tara:strand:+ start:253 stop:1056 length:804 start_codon:yes stop_codon:yes gene_type:complete
MKEISKNIVKDGYAIIKNCISLKLLDKIQLSINEKLENTLKVNSTKNKQNLSKNYYNLAKKLSQFDIQKMLSEHLIKDNLIDKIFKEEKLIENLIYLIGPDLSYLIDYEMAINDKKNTNKDYYFIKKYHQEFWSGMGLESLQLWIPINLKKGMGTLNIIKSSHEWGHIPHQDRQPLKLPKKYKTENLKINNGSVAILSALTLHSTIKNNHKDIRIALPITVRNFYYPNKGNSDLFNFKKINNSFFTILRKKLGNPQYSPFRTMSLKN